MLMAIGMVGNYREACGADGWGSFILVVFGILILTLLAASAPDVAPGTRLLRLLLGAVLLAPGSILLQAMFKESVRFAC